MYWFYNEFLVKKLMWYVFISWYKPKDLQPILIEFILLFLIQKKAI